jgi:hypothetical protein
MVWRRWWGMVLRFIMRGEKVNRRGKDAAFQNTSRMVIEGQRISRKIQQEARRI